MNLGFTAAFSGNAACLGTSSISRPRQPASGPRGSAVSSMTKCTRCSGSAIILGKACITSPWAAQWTIPGSPPCRHTSFSLEAARWACLRVRAKKNSESLTTSSRRPRSSIDDCRHRMGGDRCAALHVTTAALRMLRRACGWELAPVHSCLGVTLATFAFPASGMGSTAEVRSRLLDGAMKSRAFRNACAIADTRSRNADLASRPGSSSLVLSSRH